MTQKLRVGFIGAGWWATEQQLPWFSTQPDVELVGVCRLGKPELDLVKSKFGFGFATEDYHELVRQPLDAVVVASPHVAHYEHALAALNAGLHVMVEKPMTVKAAQAHELRNLAVAKGLHVLVPMGWNFARYVQEARGLVAQGIIGEPRHVVCQMASALGDLMSGQPMAETANAQFRPPSSTWADPKRGGGYGYGQLSHALGALFALVDLQPSEVTAFMGASASGADYYDAINVRFTNGGTAAISGSSTIPKGPGNDRSKGYQMDIRIFGTEGMLLLDIERERCEIRRNDGRDTSVSMALGDGGYPAAVPWRTFVDLALGKRQGNPSDAALGAKTIEVLDAAYLSAADGGRVVRVEEIVG